MSITQDLSTRASATVQDLIVFFVNFTEHFLGQNQNRILIQLPISPESCIVATSHPSDSRAIEKDLDM
jgi:hypothetical protein